MREVPRVAGAGGGVGCSTMATALGGVDAGVYRGGDPVHVLVCRSTMASIGAAQRAIASAPTPPVLAVVADVPRASLTRPVRARLRMTEPHVTAIISVPHVVGWREVADPWTAAATWRQPDLPLPRALRGFTAAMRQIVGAVTPLLRDVAFTPSVAQRIHVGPGRAAQTGAAAPPVATPRPPAEPAVIAARTTSRPRGAARGVSPAPGLPTPAARPGPPTTRRPTPPPSLRQGR